MLKTVTVMNTASGRVGAEPASYLTHPVFGKYLVEVPEGTKSYDPEFYTPTDAEGWRAKPANRAKKSAKMGVPGAEETPDAPEEAPDAD